MQLLALLVHSRKISPIYERDFSSPYSGPSAIFYPAGSKWGFVPAGIGPPDSLKEH
jgi:hypothetical protein